MRRRALLVPLAAALAACGSHRPPEDLTPDPALLARIRELRFETADAACPGRSFAARYVAVLDDGTTRVFATRYDEDNPPALHVVFLARESDEATPLRDGGWRADPDPLISALDGFRLRAALRDRPEIHAEVTVAPDYSCQSHVYQFEGSPVHPGRPGAPGGDGPDVTVRLGTARTRFYPRLYVVGLEVADAPPAYLLFDADAVPPADFLRVESNGGRGMRGSTGADGTRGVDGIAGCPGTPGGPGGPGGDGGRGGPGGRGGRITVMVPEGEALLAGLVDGRTLGGEGGSGGKGGDGGAGGKGGGGATDANGVTCTPHVDGPKGGDGRDGPEGYRGQTGDRVRVLTVPARDVFGRRAPRALTDLLDN